MSKHYCSVIFLLLMYNAFVSAQIGRMLFIDTTLMVKNNLQRVHHSPVYYEGNPILKADKKWELNSKGDPYAAPFSGGLWYDEVDKKFKMWYSAGGEKAFGLITCYAESLDGKTWTKPNLDVVSGTNIVDTTEHDCVTVLLDKSEKNPEKRYKMFVVGFNNGSSVSMQLKYSSDGIHWSMPKALSGELYDRCSVYYDPFRQKYILSLKTIHEKYRRSRSYLEHEDPEMLVSLAHRVYDNKSDKFIRYWFNADEDDPRNPHFPEIRPQIYNHEAMSYEGWILGYFTIWQGPENNVCDSLKIQKRNEVLIGWSKDGFHWNRENKTPFLPVTEDAHAWNAGNVQSTAGNPLIVGDSLYFYVSGRYNPKPKGSSNFSTGLAMLRRDGFVSMRAGKKEGCLETKLLVPENGSYLFINADVMSGKVLVELSDIYGKPIEGYEKSNCVVVKKANSTKQVVTWKKQKSIASLKGQEVCLKFYLTNGDMYSFWISPHSSGESGGYTGGGGPGLNACGRDCRGNEIHCTSYY